MDKGEIARVLSEVRKRLNLSQVELKRALHRLEHPETPPGDVELLAGDPRTIRRMERGEVIPRGAGLLPYFRLILARVGATQRDQEGSDISGLEDAAMAVALLLEKERPLPRVRPEWLERAGDLTRRMWHALEYGDRLTEQVVRQLEDMKQVVLEFPGRDTVDYLWFDPKDETFWSFSPETGPVECGYFVRKPGGPIGDQDGEKAPNSSRQRKTRAFRKP